MSIVLCKLNTIRKYKLSFYRHLLFLIGFYPPFLFSAQANQSHGNSTYHSALKEAGVGNYAQAIEDLKKEIASDTSATDAYLRLAEYYHYSRTLSIGQQYLRAAIDKNPQNANLYLALAELQSYGNDWRQTSEYCVSALDRGSTAEETVDLLIRSALQNKDTDKLPQILGNLRRQDEQKHLYSIGYAIWRLHIENLKRAKSTISDFLKTSPKQAYALKILGDINARLNNPRQSIENYLSVLQLVDDKKVNLRISTLRGLAVNYAQLGVPDSTDIYLHKSEALARQVGALDELVELKEFAKEFYEQQGQYLEMAQKSAEAIAILEEQKESARLPDFYYSLASGWERMGDTFRALESYFEVLAEIQGKGRTELEAKINLGIGRSFLVLEKWPVAEEHLNRSAELARETGQSSIEHEALLNLGDVYKAEGNIDKAKAAYQQVLSFAQSIQKHDLTERCFVSLANLYLHPPSELSHATYYLDMADALARQTFHLQFAANHRWMHGEIALLQQDIEKAEIYFSHSIQLGKESGSYLSILAGQAGIIRTYLKANFIDLAAAQADTALDYLLKHFSLIRNESTWQFFDLKNDFIIPAATAYAKIGDPAKVYELCEQYKAMEQVIHLTNLKYMLKQPLADSINSRMESIDRQINRKWENLWDAWKKDKSDNLDVVMKLKDEIRNLQIRKQAELENMAQTYPKYYRLFQPKIEPLAKIGDSLQKFNGTLIDYLVGENSTFVLVVQGHSIYCKQIDVGNGQLRDLIEQVSPVFTRDYVEQSLRNGTAPPAFRLDITAKLYESLFASVKSWIPDQTNLIISTDGVLSRLPFECLVANPDELMNNHDYEHAHYLLEDYTISYIPNASFLNFSSNKNRNSTRGFLAAAHAKMTVPDNLYFALDQKKNDHSNGKVPSVKENLEQELKQLKNTLSIPRSKIYAEKNIDKKQFIDACPDYQIIHLALPRYLEDNLPLFAKFFFSTNSGKGDFLETFQLFDLHLSADLIALNSTAIVPENSNSGAALNTLFYGFYFAGVPSMITNLWTLHEHNKEIWTYFYANLKEGLDKPAALREAQLRYLSQGQRNPFFWAGLVLNGTPGSIEFKASHISFIIATTLLGVLILFSLVIWHFLKIRGEGSEPA